MTIRIMMAEDYDAVYALWQSCTGMGLNNLDDSREGIRKFLDRNPQTCFVAEQDGRITGVILTGYDGRRGYIYHAAVSPEHRHMKTASGLVEAALNALKTEGATKVALVAFRRNQEGNIFWEKQGFSFRDDLNYWDKELVQMIRNDT